ncbi:MAG: DUF4290 domain-containing protein [Bacteroidales bacterium]
MDYNTNRPDLVLPEYGRHVHKMVDYLKTIHDRDFRNQMAKSLIEIMGTMNPHLRDVPDFKHKLWDHLAIMADFELDIDWPYPLPDREEISKSPNRLTYSDSEFGFKHYGKNLQKMLNVLPNYDEETQLMLLKQLANHMKKSYVNWKKESVNDDAIFDDIEKITGGKIKIPRDKVTLADVKHPKQTQQIFQNKNNKKKKKSKRY